MIMLDNSARQFIQMLHQIVWKNWFEEIIFCTPLPNVQPLNEAKKTAAPGELNIVLQL